MPLAQKFAQPEARFAWKLAQLNWLVVAAMGASLAIGMVACRFTIGVFDLACVLGIAAVYGGFGWFHLYRKTTPDPNMTFMLTGLGQLVFIVAFMGPLTYVAGALNLPLQDQLFLKFDRAIGLDPKALLDFVNARPELAQWLSAGYGMIKWPLIAIPIILGMTLRFRRIQLFVLAFAIALAVTLVVSAVVPAIGTYYGLGIDAQTLINIDSKYYAKQLRDIPALRDGSLRDLQLFELAGIVAFPSFHAASGVIYGWALWPVRGFGPLAVLLNAAMLVATPIIGAHYAIDVIGGIVVAWASIALATRIAERLERPAVAGAQSTGAVAAV